METIIRKAVSNDLESIVAIYNEAIIEGGKTADTTTYKIEDKTEWFNAILNDKYGIYVLQLQNAVIGYFYFTAWRKGRKSLETVKEISFYLRKKSQGLGFGDIILENLITVATQKKISFLIAIIIDENLKSKSILEKWGFKLIGSLPNIVKLESKNIGQHILLKGL